MNELRVAAGVFALGFLVFTLMLKVAVPISLGEFLAEDGGDGGQALTGDRAQGFRAAGRCA